MAGEAGPDTKELILKTATELFARKGYKGTSVRDIVRETGINISMISYYFQGKKGILKAILQIVVDDFDLLMGEGPVMGDNDELLELVMKLQIFVADHSNEMIILLDKFNRNIEELEMVIPVFESRMKTIVDYVSEVSGLALEESKENAYLLTEMWLAMFFSGQLLGLTDLIKDEQAPSADLERKRRRITRLITEFILQNTQELLIKLNEAS